MPFQVLRQSFAAAVFVLLFLSACTTPDGPKNITAKLLIDGNTVHVNGEPARFGQSIQQGDFITTGPGSSARIRFSDGTTVQLDQETDPIFSWSAERLRIRMQIGLIAIIKGSVIEVVEVLDDVAELFVRSRAAVEHSQDDTFRIDLFEGSVELVRPAGERLLAPGEFFKVTPDGEVSFGITSRERLKELDNRIDKAWDFTSEERRLVSPFPSWLRRWRPSSGGGGKDGYEPDRPEVSDPSPEPDLPIIE